MFVSCFKVGCTNPRSHVAMFLNFKSNFLVKRVFLLNAAFAISVLVLISHHLLSCYQNSWNTPHIRVLFYLSYSVLEMVGLDILITLVTSVCRPSCCKSYCGVFPLETLPVPLQRSKCGSSIPPDCFISRGSISHFSVFLERDCHKILVTAMTVNHRKNISELNHPTQFCLIRRPNFH